MLLGMADATMSRLEKCFFILLGQRHLDSCTCYHHCFLRHHIQFNFAYGTSSKSSKFICICTKAIKRLLGQQICRCIKLIKKARSLTNLERKKIHRVDISVLPNVIELLTCLALDLVGLEKQKLQNNKKKKKIIKKLVAYTSTV